jgi:pilus assembly protein CpaB
VNRRALSAVIAVVLAVAGMIGIVVYVNDAEDRAQSGETLVEVWVVTRRVPPGTSASDIDRYVSLDTVPQKLVNDSSVSNLIDLTGLVADVELLEGETLSASRWVSPTVFARDQKRVIEVPDGLQEVSLSLSPERAGGGLIVPGDRVGVIMSFQPFDFTSEVPIEIDGIVVPPNGKTPNTTTLALHKVLVTNIQLERVPEIAEKEGIGDEEDQDVRLVPSGNLLVTVAVDTFTAERLIFGAEFGTLWFSNEGTGAVESPSAIQTRGTIYQDLQDLFDLGILAVAASDGGE